jgi:small subunit ribosomal protein S27e
MGGGKAFIRISRTPNHGRISGRDQPCRSSLWSANRYFILESLLLLTQKSTSLTHRYLVRLTEPNSAMPRDLLHPDPEEELLKHKLKRLVQAPNSFFMDIKCPNCFQITTVFSHAQTIVSCQGCNMHLCEPTGGKARLTDGCSYRKKAD